MLVTSFKPVMSEWVSALAQFTGERFWLERIFRSCRVFSTLTEANAETLECSFDRAGLSLAPVRMLRTWDSRENPWLSSGPHSRRAPQRPATSAWSMRDPRTDNIVYGGPYRNPDDLEEIYRPIHFICAVDYLDEGTNSDWLLPNRIYEGGRLGPSLLLEKARRQAGASRSMDLELLLQSPLRKN